MGKGARLRGGHAVRATARVLPVSQTSERAIVRLFPSARPEITVIPNGSDEHFHPRPLRNNFRENSTTRHLDLLFEEGDDPLTVGPNSQQGDVCLVCGDPVLNIEKMIISWHT